MITSISKKEWAFLLYFLPLFAIKLLDITSASILLKLVGVICVLLFALNISQNQYKIQYFRLFVLLILYSAVLVFTSGKQGVFFSMLMLFSMYGINMNKHIYKVCFSVGVLFLVGACINAGNGSEVTRFMNGEWVTMVKRSNLLYVSYTAVLCLYLFMQQEQLTKLEFIAIVVISYCMYLYVGSRTGLGAIALLLVLIVLLKKTKCHKLGIIKYGCILSPLICMVFCVYSGLKYGKNPIWEVLNMMLQGRIEQNNAYLERYDIRLFGQHIYESTDVNDFWILDCAYLDMLICSGLLFALLWIVFNGLVIKYMYERKRMIAVSVLVMYAVYGISETFLPNCFLNMSFFIYGQYIYEHCHLQKNKQIRT